MFQTQTIVVGRNSDGKDVLIKVTPDGYLLSKLMLLDTESESDNDVQATCDAQGRQYISQAFTGDLTITMGDVEKLLANQYYLRMKPYSHSSGRLKYICKNTDIDAGETDTDWFIWKYSDEDIPEIEGPRSGAVNTEAVINGLSWNI